MSDHVVVKEISMDVVRMLMSNEWLSSRDASNAAATSRRAPLSTTLTSLRRQLATPPDIISTVYAYKVVLEQDAKGAPKDKIGGSNNNNNDATK